ncbi:MAG: alpha/beta hydrolase [Actinomycetota bacterium]|nr:alpha/beta hydrolase [Actinomycetota bacterium]
MAIVDLNGVRLGYDDEGAGPPLVLVHGSWTNRHGWDRVAPKLARRFRVLRHDRRGHSESGPAQGTLDEDAVDIAALAEHLRLGPFHLACSSQGGVIGLKLAAARPDLVRSIVCHEPPLTSIVPPDAADRTKVEQALATEGVVDLIDAGEHESAARLFVEEVAFGPGTWDRMPRAMRSMFIENADTFAEEQRDPSARELDVDGLRRFPGRALLTTSENSPEWPRVVFRYLSEILPRVERHVYASAGHNPQGTAPDQYVDVVGGFIARAEAR